MTTTDEPSRRQAYALAALADLRVLESRLEELRRRLRVLARAERIVRAEAVALYDAADAAEEAWQRLDDMADHTWGAALTETADDEEE